MLHDKRTTCNIVGYFMIMWDNKGQYVVDSSLYNHSLIFEIT
jgi:uncharacterized protein YegP (UPF0339 family)